MDSNNIFFQGRYKEPTNASKKKILNMSLGKYKPKYNKIPYFKHTRMTKKFFKRGKLVLVKSGEIGTLIHAGGNMR